tara:strand:- start:574 stop:1092 length:519 start_codon:yes stop_codon:yes gene_type:complete
MQSARASPAGYPIFDKIVLKTLTKNTYQLENVALNSSNETIFNLVAEKLSVTKDLVRVLFNGIQFSEFEPHRYNDLKEIYFKNDWGEHEDITLHILLRLGPSFPRRHVDPFTKKECSICFDKKVLSDFFCITPCKHSLCGTCLSKIKICHICRGQIQNIHKLIFIPDNVKVY